MKRYILSIDQSTQGTKAIVLDINGKLVSRAHCLHKQIINEKGWVEHDPEELLSNTAKACREAISAANIPIQDIAAIGITNQRETTLIWDRITGRPVANAIVWQCSRAAEICQRSDIVSFSERIKSRTGMMLSPFFPAAKAAWLMENIPEAKELATKGRLCCGTIDSWLIYSLTEERNFYTDVSNASRTQLLNIRTLEWDKDICALFGISLSSLPEIQMSDHQFGTTKLFGILEKPVPICAVMGDSHAALWGQNCLNAGDIKATYGTGSSVMMNTGNTPIIADNGLLTSLAWGFNGKISYVLEGNINYTGAVISWLKNDMKLIENDDEASLLALKANPYDKTYFIPAFTGLGAPYWDSQATGMFTGISRKTGKNEIVRACLECIAYQITDIIHRMRNVSKMAIKRLRVDGGPTASEYLMQFQSDISDTMVSVPEISEISGMGVAFAAGISADVYDINAIYDTLKYQVYTPKLNSERRQSLYGGWQNAVHQVLSHN